MSAGRVIVFFKPAHLCAPRTRNASCSPNPLRATASYRALGLFLFSKLAFSKARGAPPFFVYGLGGKAAAQTSRRGGMGEFWAWMPEGVHA